MNKDQKVKYVLVEQTVKELWEKAKNNGTYSTDIYEHNIEHPEYTEEQKKIQSDNRWQSSVTNDIRYRENSFYEMIKKTMEEELSNGTRENLEEKIYNSIMDTNIRTYIVVKPETGNCYIESEYGDENEDSTYVYDENKMEKEVRKVITHGWNRDTDVYIDSIRVSIYNYNLQELDDKLKKLIKKYIRNEFTYCIKQNKVIVPEEYIAKGHEGIEEWRNIKASKNKNNNMEKKMLRGMVRDKKRDIVSQMQRLVWGFPKGQNNNGSVDWTMPYLYIYGSGNKAMNTKLANQIIGAKTDAELLNMSEEEVEKEFKDYWKGVLMRAVKQLDSVDTYEKENHS